MSKLCFEITLKDYNYPIWIIAPSEPIVLGFLCFYNLVYLTLDKIDYFVPEMKDCSDIILNEDGGIVWGDLADLLEEIAPIAY